MTCAPETRGGAGDQMAMADGHGLLFETVHQRRDGRTFPVEVSSQGAVIGETPTLISVIRDITAHRQVESQNSINRDPPTASGQLIAARNPDRRD